MMNNIVSDELTKNLTIATLADSDISSLRDAYDKIVQGEDNDFNNPYSEMKFDNKFDFSMVLCIDPKENIPNNRFAKTRVRYAQISIQKLEDKYCVACASIFTAGYHQLDYALISFDISDYSIGECLQYLVYNFEKYLNIFSYHV